MPGLKWKNSFHKSLGSWFEDEFRELPWRQTRDPYKIWISEIMLQQTQVKTVVPYYLRFIRALPTLKTLAETNLEHVLKLWEGLGYYARARNIHKTARHICSTFDGVFPNTIDKIQSLAGIGPYTAAAIHSIAFGGDHAVVDGNVKRVLARLFCVEEEINSREGIVKIEKLAQQCLARGNAGTYNQAIMELGAVICRPRLPLCERCPVNDQCMAFKHKRQTQFPKKAAKKPKPHYTVAIGLIFKNHKILITRRPCKGMLGGLWEFPGGKLDPALPLSKGLAQKIEQHIAVKIRVGEKVTVIQHGYTHFDITMHAFRCTLVSGIPQCRECIQWRWIDVRDLDKYAFPRADKKVIEQAAFAG